MESSTSNTSAFAPRPGRGIQEAQVWAAADALIQEGQRPTIERVRQKIGSGSPNTVSPMLERWFATLGQRLAGRNASLAAGEAHALPSGIVEAAKIFWQVACHEAEQAQVQAVEAARREIALQREALLQRESDLEQRESSFEQARVALDEAVASSRQAVAAIEAQVHTQQQESARLLADSEAEVRRLRKALQHANDSKEALREKAAMDLAAALREAKDAEQRHEANGRRLLNDVDRERMAAKQMGAELEKQKKSRAIERDSARAELGAAAQALQQSQTAHRDAAALWARELHDMKVDLATWRERAAAAEQRTADLVDQLERQQTRAEREILQLRESQIAATEALRQLATRGAGTLPDKNASKTGRSRTSKTPK